MIRPIHRRRGSLLFKPALAVCFGLVNCLPGVCLGYENIQVNGVNDNPEETSIVIDPRNPDHIVGVAQIPPRSYTTFDGGVSWIQSAVPDTNALGDPVVAITPDGTVLFSYVSPRSHSGIFVNRSDDGGLTWQVDATRVIEHVGDTPLEDRPYLVVDWTQGSSRGNVYVVWTEVYGQNAQVFLVRSTDGGRSFSSPVPVTDQLGLYFGATAAVGPQGEVYVAWGGSRRTLVDVSFDLGRSFGEDVALPGEVPYNLSPGRVFRAYPMPSLAVDVSSSRLQGRVYVSRCQIYHDDYDVVLLYSDDHGMTWSGPLRINDDPVDNMKSQYFPWLACDPGNGDLYAVFYDRRGDAEFDVYTDVYLATSRSGGTRFTNEEISDRSFTSDPFTFAGDYIGISAYAGRVRPLWTRIDSDTLSIWTALIDHEAAPPVAKLFVYPNPTDGEVQILYSGFSNAPLAIYDVQGRLVRSLQPMVHPSVSSPLRWDGLDLSGRRVPGGVYFISANGGVGTSRVVVTR